MYSWSHTCACTHACTSAQKSLGLTEEQKRDLMISRTFVLTSLASLLEERGQLAHTLQVSSRC